jgi:deoxyribodipyrimidine photo-lyase
MPPTPRPAAASDGPAIVWFRDDLRLSDNPALTAAVETGRPLLCLYVFEEDSAHIRPLGGASRWWLHHSLTDLAERLHAAGSRLDVFTGSAAGVLAAVAEDMKAGAVFWSRRYGAAERAVDDRVEKHLRARDIVVETFNGTLLHEPSAVRSKTGTAFRVFTPFLRASVALGSPGKPLPAPERLPHPPAMNAPKGHTTIDALALLPSKPDWSGGLRATWTPGEAAAQAALHDFLASGIASYGEDRNRPALAATSRLSPHLRFGEISPRQVATKARHAADAGAAAEGEVDKFLSELIWRDFAHNLLVEHPDLAVDAVQPAFRHFPYRAKDGAALDAWQRGRTGYPIVDAGMRELWQTGVMHNRVRMIAASFLIKHLLMDWRLGEQWFWDTLCDADPASNPMNWQWVAGSGADPAPYFRIFNPTLQGEKFDGKGDYVRRYVPELAALPAQWIHQPSEAPPDVLSKAGVTLGETYPRPIVEHEVARDRALKALAAMRHAAHD